MLKFVERKDINDEKWNATVQGSDNFTIYGLTWFLDSICNQWGGIVNDEYDLVFPVNYGNKYFISYAFQPYFTPAFDIYSNKQLNKNIYSELLKLLKKRFFKFELRFSHFIPNQYHNVKVSNKKVQILNLDSSYEAIYSNYSKSNKKNIKKAISKGFSVRYIELDNEVVNLFQNFYESRGLRIINNFDNYKKTLKKLSKKGLLKIVGAFDDNGEMQSAIILIEISKSKLSFRSANTLDGRKYRSMFLATDFIIKDHADKNLFLDFEGSSIESIREVNLGFGSYDQKVYSVNHSFISI